MAKRIERAPCCQCRIKCAAAFARIGPARPHYFARLAQRRSQSAQPRRQQCFKPQPQRLGEACRCAPGANRQQHRRAIKNAGNREIAQVRPVRNIDQHPARLEPRRRRFGIIECNERQSRLCVVFTANHAAHPFDQPALGQRRLALAQHDHRLPGDAVEQGEALDWHCSHLNRQRVGFDKLSLSGFGVKLNIRSC